MLDLKSFDAVWLIHIAGDIHQPLHSVTRYQSASDKGDAGGNGVTLSGHAGKLHTYWDHLPDHILTQNLQPSPTALVSIDDPGAWAKESFRFAVNDGYVSPIGEGIGPFTLNAAYESNALKRAHFQIELAGERLARLFESSLH